MPDPKPTPLVEAFALGPFATNCFLVHMGPGREGWIIDAGMEPSPLIDRARDLDLRIEGIYLTHAHGDHIAGLDDVRAAFPGVPVAMHRAEADWLGDPTLNLSGGFPGARIVVAPADRMLDGGESLELGGSEWKVLHTPGHSPGGLTFHCPDAHVALVGDTLFAGSIGRYDFPTSDPDALARSLRALLEMPDDTRILPGHGPSTTIGRERTTNPFLQGPLE